MSITHTRRLIAENPGGAELAAYTVREFCAAHRLSRALFYKMDAAQRPAILKIGRRTIISRESAEAWRAKMTQRDQRTED